MTRILLLRSLQVVLDLAVLSLAVWLAVYLRFEGGVPEQMLKRLIVQWPYVVGLQYALLTAFGIPRFSWRYIGLREAVHILQCVAAGAFVPAGPAWRALACSAMRFHTRRKPRSSTPTMSLSLKLAFSKPGWFQAA